MSRYSSASSYNHNIRRIFDDCFEIAWTVDHHYPSSRLRWPRVHRRVTDTRGAERFGKKWGVAFPQPPEVTE